MFDFLTPELFHNAANGLVFGVLYVVAIAFLFWAGERLVERSRGRALSVAPAAPTDRATGAPPPR